MRRGRRGAWGEGEGEVIAGVNEEGLRCRGETGGNGEAGVC